MLSLLLGLALVTTPPAQAPASPQAPDTAATPAPPVEDPYITLLALKIYAQMRAGKVDPALLSAKMKDVLAPEVLAQTRSMLDTLGDVTRIRLESRAAIGDGTEYVYLVTFAAAQLHVKIYIDSGGKVGGYSLSL